MAAPEQPLNRNTVNPRQRPLVNPSPSNRNPAYAPQGADNSAGVRQPPVTSPGDGSKAKAVVAAGTKTPSRSLKP
jgi:hypothetical protein